MPEVDSRPDRATAPHSARHAIPRFIAILAVILGSVWYIVAWSDQQPFKLLAAAGIVIFLINPFEMTKPLNAFERVMVAVGIGFALYVSITLGWTIVQEWIKAAPKPIYA
ncbi:MAG: hypothetical protein DI556_13330 [Rhodovulum sulfidophilum]|uniref:Uncharacterized protein n=1 Tax=Rhodovulum sulfidophilum TaxID=35806 RepID=A0A2W5N5M5_RHOSU|nr:MAG: hypothetical protein DI556_13330 [Rhodovulum sulfidophilum]